MFIEHESIPWSKPWLNNLESDSVSKIFETNWLSMGPCVKEFESKMATLVGSKFAVATNNGTSALEIALRAKNVGAGDTVVVPSFTYFATVSAVVRTGATPLFVDAGHDSFNLCPIDLATKISSNTKAVVYIDYGGFPANYVDIKNIAHAAGATVIHDAAQSLGTTRNGKSIVSEGDISTTSFHAAKLITTIEGGMIFCDDKELHEKIKRIRNQGEEYGQKYIHQDFGLNARMTDIQAAIGLVQLIKMGSILERRQELAENYTRMLNGFIDIKTHSSGYLDSDLAWMLYPILIKGRDKVAADLSAVGIDTRIAYPIPTYQQPCVSSKYPDLDSNCPRTEQICSQVLNLPMFHDMTELQQRRITDEIKKSVEKWHSFNEGEK